MQRDWMLSKSSSLSSKSKSERLQSSDVSRSQADLGLLLSKLEADKLSVFPVVLLITLGRAIALLGGDLSDPSHLSEREFSLLRIKFLSFLCVL